MRFSGMVYPLAWQALIDRLLAGRKIRRGGNINAQNPEVSFRRSPE
jgi:hypothetical protein